MYYVIGDQLQFVIGVYVQHDRIIGIARLSVVDSGKKTGQNYVENKTKIILFGSKKKIKRYERFAKPVFSLLKHREKGFT